MVFGAISVLLFWWWKKALPSSQEKREVEDDVKKEMKIHHLLSFHQVYDPNSDELRDWEDRNI